MYLHVAYHLHGYQPGDVILLEESSPFEPIKYRERKSPLTLEVAGNTVYGNNWTDAVLNGYRLFPEAFNKLAGRDEKVVSVDIEPFTLVCYANKFGITALLDLLSIFSKNVEFVSTPPFHPPLSLMHRVDQLIITRAMWDLTLTVFEKYWRETEGFLPYGVWLPENLYTLETAHIVTEGFASMFYHLPHLRTKKPKLFFILDKRQFLEPKFEHYLYSLNYIEVADTKVFVFGRIPEISDIFAFSRQDITTEEFIKDMLDKLKMKRDETKETEHIPYIVTLSSDLESLVSNGKQIEKFRALPHSLKNAGITPTAISDYACLKLSNRLKRWEGEGESKEFYARIKENSSWSDYADLLIDGKTSDTRWIGMRRADGKVISRRFGKHKVSQIWKQGYNQFLYIVTRAVRNKVFEIISSETGVKNQDVIINFLVLYNRIYFKPLYLAVGIDKSSLSYDTIAAQTIGLAGNHERIARAARAYYNILAANRSCSRFWDIIDTRVTFQSTVYAAHALIDLMKLCWDREQVREKLFNMFTLEFLNFRSNFGKFGLGSLYGVEGWEVTEPAWLAATQSMVPDLSPYDVVRRAGLFAALHSLPQELLCRIRYEKEFVRADTAHIPGEMHGHWENMKYCEHRG
ncbi:MAG: hypothetical protein N3F63_06620 [Thermoplasmata archaeon]|nr:hypothetical protein [Thermoplasmata archaeon]